MYMRNNKKRGNSGHYNIDSLPPNYSGQYSTDNFTMRSARGGDRGNSYGRTGDFDFEDEIIEGSVAPEEGEKHEIENKPEKPEEAKKGSILDSLGSIFKRRDDGGGFLGNLFSGKKIKNIFTDLDFEDLILLGVMFFLLRDGAEDDLLIILAILLFTG